MALTTKTKRVPIDAEMFQQIMGSLAVSVHFVQEVVLTPTDAGYDAYVTYYDHVDEEEQQQRRLPGV